MKLSAAASKVVYQLAAGERGQSWFRQILGKKNASPLLRKLGELNEPAALPDVAHFLTSTDRETRAAARETVAALLEQISAWDLLALEEQSLWWNASDRIQNRSRIQPADVSAIAGNPDQREYAAVLSLLSFHKNGYVRQEAVRLLAEIDRNEVLPCLVIRQNDWVKPIAEAAQKEVRRRLQEGPICVSHSLLELIFQMETWSRYDHRPMIGDLVKRLLEEEQDRILEQQILELTVDAKLGRSIVRYALSYLRSPTERLLLYGLISKDPVIRYQCCRGLRALPVEASEVLPLQDRMLFLERLASDPFLPVRSEAFRQLAVLDPANAVTTWEAALLDRSRSIQEMACYYLNRIDPGHAVRFYRDAVELNPESLPAIEGLAAVGEASDLEFLRTLFVHPFPSRRCAGIRAVVRLLQRDAISEVMPFLRDSSPRVVRTAGKSLRPWITQIASEDLLAVVLKADTLYARSYACELLAEQGKWSSFPWLLEAVVHSEPETAAVAAAMIQSWCSAGQSYRVFTRPSAEERVKIGEKLARFQSQVPEQLVQQIERELSLYS